MLHPKESFDSTSMGLHHINYFGSFTTTLVASIKALEMALKHKENKKIKKSIVKQLNLLPHDLWRVSRVKGLRMWQRRPLLARSSAFRWSRCHGQLSQVVKKLCPCIPNTGGNAKSSLPAIVSHLTFHTVVQKRGLGMSETRSVKGDKSGRNNPATFSAPFWELSTLIPPNNDLVRMWTAQVGEDEHKQTLPPTAPARCPHRSAVVVVSTWPSLYACNGNINISIYRLRHQHDSGTDSVHAGNFCSVLF